MPNSWLTLAELDRCRLQNNLAVLYENQPSLVPRIEREKDRTDILVRPIEKGFFQCKRRDGQGETWIHGEREVNQEAAQYSQQIQQAFDRGAWLVLAHDVGLGYAVHEMAIQLEFQRRGEPKGIVCLKRDPGLVCAAFSLFDFTTPIRTGRILWAIGDDLDRQVRDLCRDHHLETLDAQQIRVVPDLHANGSSISEANQGIHSAISAFWDVHRTLRNQYFENLQEAERYWSKPIDKINRVWTHLNTDRGGAEMILGLIEGFRELGIEARAPMLTDRFFTRFYRVAADFFAFRPDLVLCQNHSSNYTVSFAQQIPIPRVVWYVDDPENMANVPFHPNDRIFSTSKLFESEIQRRGKKLEGVVHAAAPSELSPPIRNCEWRHTVSYVGSVTDNRRLLDAMPEDLRERINRAVSTMQKSPLSADIRQTILRAFDADRIARAAQIVSGSIPKARIMSPTQALLYFVYMEANARRRVQAISALENVDGLGIYGPADWRELLPTERLKKAFLGPIGSRADLLKLYQTSRINLCFNSLQGFGFINQRVFDVPAAGGFILTEWAPLLPETFQADECAWFRSLQEMLDMVRRYAEADGERCEIVRRAQERIRAAHTYVHRAKEIRDVLASQSACA